MSDDALLALMRSLAAGDGPSVLRSIDQQPELATAALARGATRQAPDAHFLPELRHHVYAGDTALHVAAAAHHVDVIEALLRHGADVEAVNRRGARPLHYAVDGGPGSDRWDPTAQRRTIEALLASGADPEAFDRNGTTPLLRAVRNRCADAVDALIRGGADPTRANAKGSTAMRLATTDSGKSGSGSPAARAEQARIVALLEAATRPSGSR